MVPALTTGESRLVASSAAAAERPAIQRPSAVSPVKHLNLPRSNDLHDGAKRESAP
jgi:hypothetical protein